MKVAVMFKVPFNICKKHPIKYGVGLFDVRQTCDAGLYQEMTRSTGTFVSGRATGAALKYSSQNISVMASMSDCHSAVLKVQLTED